MVRLENITQVLRSPGPQTGCFTAKPCWHQERDLDYCLKELFGYIKEAGYRLDSHGRGAIGNEVYRVLLTHHVPAFQNCSQPLERNMKLDFLKKLSLDNQHSRPVCDSVGMASVPGPSTSVPQLLGKAEYCKVNQTQQLGLCLIQAEMEGLVG